MAREVGGGCGWRLVLGEGGELFGSDQSGARSQGRAINK